MIRSLHTRSIDQELLDQPDIPKSDLFRNLQELEWINTLLGGHAITINGLKQLIHGNRTKIWKITDLGCGGGDTLRAVSRWAQKHGIPVQLTGIDFNPDCIEYARKHSANYPDISFICADFRTHIPPETNILINALFCHHLDEASLTDLLVLLEKKSAIGFVINDLHRHPIAYSSIWILTRLLNGSRLVRHDAPLSVARSFKRIEWELLLSNSGISNWELRWKWAFRWQIVGRK